MREWLEKIGVQMSEGVAGEDWSKDEGGSDWRRLEYR